MGFFDSILGGAAGFASGGQLGAAVGIAGGLFGGDRETVARFKSLSPAQRQIIEQIGRQMPGLLEQMTPDAFESLVGQLGDKFTELGRQDVKTAFAKQKGSAMSALSRTGTGVSSVRTSQLGQLGAMEGQELSRATIMGQQAAESIAGARMGAYSQMAGQMSGIMSNIYGSRRQVGQSTPGQFRDSLFGEIGGALVDQQSWINQNDRLKGVNDWLTGLVT